jgi:hypothetical protein
MIRGRTRLLSMMRGRLRPLSMILGPFRRPPTSLGAPASTEERSDTDGLDGERVREREREWEPVRVRVRAREGERDRDGDLSLDLFGLLEFRDDPDTAFGSLVILGFTSELVRGEVPLFYTNTKSLIKFWYEPETLRRPITF